MSSRYFGRVITAENIAQGPTSSRGVWNLVEHVNKKFTNRWPSAFLLQPLGGNAYSATGVGPVNDISQVASALVSAGLYDSIAASGYLRYNIKTGISTSKVITVWYDKMDDNVNGVLVPSFSQSAFSLFGQTVQYTSDITSLLFYANDDHDTLFMDSDGAGVIARSNVNELSQNLLVDKYRGGVATMQNAILNSTVTHAPGSFVTTGVVPITFPKTNGCVWLNLENGRYKVNGFNPVTLNPLPIISGATANSLVTISDGVNKFIINRRSSTTYYVGTVNFETGTVSMVTRSLHANSSWPTANNTEEDAIGDQLFTIDGRVSLLSGTNLLYGGVYHWLNPTAGGSWWSNTQSTSTNISYAPATQTGMDVFGSIDNDGYVWFSDWGHDNGGLFNIGNDDRLNTQRTNIRLIPDEYTPS